MGLKYKVGDKLMIEVVVDFLDLTDMRYPYSVRVGGEGDTLWLSQGCLDAVVVSDTGKLPKHDNNIEVDDIVELKDELRTKVHNVVTDYFYSEEYGEDFNISDVVAIYKKSWEKPKELQDMSKEELIELVKKLKGE